MSSDGLQLHRRDDVWCAGCGTKRLKRLLGGAVTAGLSQSLHAVARWSDRLRQRHALLQLSDRELKDIGLNRYDAAAEASKPFWR